MNKEITSFRGDIYEYVNKKYNSKIEFLWRRYPNYAVFRNNDNKKWYGIIMDIPYQKLKINKDGIVDILNVKVKNPMLKDFLIHSDGIFDGYHIARGNWISILLDGSVTINKIFDLIDESFDTVTSKNSQKI